MSNCSAGLVCPKCYSPHYTDLSKPLIGRISGKLVSSTNPNCYCGGCGWEGRFADLVVDPKAPIENLTADDYYAGLIFHGSSELFAFLCPAPSGVYHHGPGCSG